MQNSETGFEREYVSKFFGHSRAALRLAPMVWRRALASHDDAILVASLRMFVFDHASSYENSSALPHLFLDAIDGVQINNAASDAAVRCSRSARDFVAASRLFEEARSVRAREEDGEVVSPDHTDYVSAGYDMLAGAESGSVQMLVEASEAFREEELEGFEVFDATWRAELNEDCQSLSFSRPLWPNSNPLAVTWEHFRGNLRQKTVLSNFWVKWYDDILAGIEPDWPFLREVALIHDAVWKAGGQAVHDAIRKLIDERDSQEENSIRELERALQGVGAPTVVAFETMRTAMVQNRRELPPTFDAVLGFIMLEIERLQGRNYFRDEDDRIEVRRQINTLAFLHETVSRLQALVPTSAEMPQASVIEAEKLSRLFIRKYQEWPRANSDELVDRTCRAALVGATTVMLPLLGITAPYALAAGMVLFSGKQMGEAAKFAIDLFKPGG